jgi:hypothetical protein
MSLRTVRGFHGTTGSSARQLIQTGTLPKLSDRPGNWLGKGFYFFEENLEMATLWTLEQVGVRARLGSFDSASVLVATLDLTDCLDFCTPKWHGPLKATAEKLKRSGRLPKQFGPEFEAANGTVSKIEDYALAPMPGVDPLDHFADSAAIDALIEDLVTSGHPVSSVRAAFTAGPQAFSNSHLFRDTHIQITVLDPERVISDIQIIKPV